MTASLSLDFGTNGVRAAVFDAESRRLLASGEAPYPTRYIPTARAEQDTDDWWRALKSLTPRVLRDAGEPQVAAITVAAFSSTVVACDRTGRALAPAILWMDARAAAESEATARIDHPLMRISGGSDAAEWLVPKATWLARCEPDLWQRTEVICEALDYENFRLTGEWAGSLMNATCKWNYDSRARAFCPELYAALGVDLTEKLPQRIIEIGQAIAPLRPEVAEELGIWGAPLVVQGGIDAHMGTFGADTVVPGSMLMIGGTSNVHLTQVPDDGTEIAGVWGPYPNALTPGLRMIEAGQVSAGSILKWLTEDIYGLDADKQGPLIDAATAIPPEANGLLALDFWMGCRTPYRDARLRGALLGLSLSHDRTSIYRAAVTGVALGAANVVADLERQGVAVDRLVIASGIVRNPLWLQSTVDAIGKPAGIVTEDNLTLRGGAAAAAVGLGLQPDLTAGGAAWRAPVEPRLPDPEMHARYRELLAEYRDTVERMTPILHALADRAEGRPVPQTPTNQAQQ